MEKTLALILAGGKGTRMGELCRTRPKPLLPMAGGYHVIDFTLSNCVHSGLKQIALLLDYQSEKVSEYMYKWQSNNGFFNRINLLVPSSDSFTGTANAVYQHIEYLEKSDADQVLVLAADQVYHLDYREMLSFHRTTGADVTVGVVNVPFDQVYKFGTVLVKDNIHIVDFVEKSEKLNSNLASMGIYVFEKRLLINRLIEDADNRRSRHDFGYSIMPDLVGRDRVFAFPFTGYWQDIGTLETYYWANMDLLESGPSGQFKWNVFTGGSEALYFGDDAQHNTQNSFIGPGCNIEGSVENSVLLSGIHVEKNAVVTSSIVMNEARVGYGSCVSRCILEEGSVIGPGCVVSDFTGIRVVSDIVTDDLIGPDGRFLISNPNKFR